MFPAPFLPARTVPPPASNVYVAQAIKPQLSIVPQAYTEPGCSTSIDDWRGNLLTWRKATQFQDGSLQLSLLMNIDGKVRSIPITSETANATTAYDGKYFVNITLVSKIRDAPELSQSKAVISIKNTNAYTETSVIGRYSSGC